MSSLCWKVSGPFFNTINWIWITPRRSTEKQSQRIARTYYWITCKSSCIKANDVIPSVVTNSIFFVNVIDIYKNRVLWCAKRCWRNSITWLSKWVAFLHFNSRNSSNKCSLEHATLYWISNFFNIGSSDRSKIIVCAVIKFKTTTTVNTESTWEIRTSCSREEIVNPQCY